MPWAHCLTSLAMTDAERRNDNDFLDAASKEERGLIAEFVGYISESKAWWILVLGLVGVLLVLSATGVMPFHYEMF